MCEAGWAEPAAAGDGEASRVVYNGPKVKKSRALGVALTPKAQRIMSKKSNPPGQHGAARRRRKSEYGLQLLEKQRLRFQYNVNERYMQRTFEAASRRSGPTGENLLQLLETRLDALVWRASFASTIYAARQYVTHGHIEVNGQKATVPSMRLRPGDTIAIRERSRKMVMFNELRPVGVVPSYVSVDGTGFEAALLRVPARDEIPVIVDDQLVVEHYSR